MDRLERKHQHLSDELENLRRATARLIDIRRNLDVAYRAGCCQRHCACVGNRTLPVLVGRALADRDSVVDEYRRRMMSISLVGADDAVLMAAAEREADRVDQSHGPVPRRSTQGRHSHKARRSSTRPRESVRKTTKNKAGDYVTRGGSWNWTTNNISGIPSGASGYVTREETVEF